MKNFTREALTIPAYSVITVDFNGTTPNYFRVNNSGANRIYAGILSLPSERMYDFAIEAKQVRMYCTDKGYPRLHLYNPGGSAIDIIVSGFNEVFSPEVLAFTDFNIADNDDKTMTVEIGGFTEPLPQGSNEIGKVTVSALPASVTNMLEDLVDYIEPLYYSDEGSVTNGSSKMLDNSSTMRLHFVSNDGENDITVKMTNKSNNQSAKVTLKPGEILTDVRSIFKKFEISTTSETACAYRIAWYKW